MVDVSHPSKGSMMQALALSKAPIIASHSAVRTLSDVQPEHGRRAADGDEEERRRRADRRVRSYVKTRRRTRPNGRGARRAAHRSSTCLPARRSAAARRGAAVARGAAAAGGAGRTGAQPCATRRGDGSRRPRRRWQRRRPRRALARSAPSSAPSCRRSSTINAKFPPPPRATVKDFVDHIDYAVKLIGIDHVGISSDFDGGGGVDGWNSADETFNVTLELVRRGYTEAADRQDLERQPAPRDGRGTGGGEDATRK